MTAGAFRLALLVVVSALLTVPSLDAGQPNVLLRTSLSDDILARPPCGANWAARHPVLFATLVGFGGGFLVGYATGGDELIHDFSAYGNGLIRGGVGAGIGAAVGVIVSN